MDFKNTIIVMTSNAGSDRAGGAVGFGRTADEQGKERVMKALQEFLRPEFINRVDEIIYFNAVGLAYTDISIAYAMYTRAREAGKGHMQDLQGSMIFDKTDLKLHL